MASELDFSKTKFKARLWRQKINRKLDSLALSHNVDA